MDISAYMIKRKLLLLSLIFAFAHLGAFAIDSVTTTRWKELSEECHKCYQLRNYANWENKLNERLSFVRTNELSNPDLSEDYVLIYYDMACAQALQHKAFEAFNSLNLAFENGFKDYERLMNDPDLANLRPEEAFTTFSNKVRERGDYVYILDKSPGYSKELDHLHLPVWTYENADSKDMSRVAEFFSLYNYSTTKDELKKIMDVCTFIHNMIKFDEKAKLPADCNSIAMATESMSTGKGVNAKGLSIILADCYMAMGIPARIVECSPRDNDGSNHVITAVWSDDQKKWLWMDPAYNAWTLDDSGDVLGVNEVREYLKEGKDVFINRTANVNNKVMCKSEDYLNRFMAKYLYYFSSHQHNGFGWDEKNGTSDFVTLVPKGMRDSLIDNDLQVTDDKWFWQRPEEVK